jgi:hypothetical protein
LRVDEVEYGEIRILDLQPIHAADYGIVLRPRLQATVHLADATHQALLQVADGSVAHSFLVEGSDARTESELARIFARSTARMGWIAAVSPRAGRGPTVQLTLQLHEFPTVLSLPSGLEVGIDERIVEQVQKRQPRLASVDDVCRWLTERVLLPPEPGQPEGAPRMLFSGEADAGSGRRVAFRLLGAGVQIDVACGADDRLRATRVTESRRAGRASARRPVQLLCCPVRFCDATVAARFRGNARTELDQLVERAGSYLRIWKEYNALEAESILRRARTLGWLRYSKRVLLPDGSWRFALEEGERLDGMLTDLANDADVCLEAATTLPPELRGIEDAQGVQDSESQPWVGEIVGSDRQRKTLDLRPLDESDERVLPPPGRGLLFVSLSGDRVRLRRREEAWSKIASAACPMPQLGMLIEGVPVPVRRTRSEEPLSPAAQRHFGGAPTTRQVAALRLALETPDIFLIQGPPGTGKTRTLAALQTRLAELTEQVRGIAGQTLLSSFQHDAVEHAAAATLVFGLPAVKLGQRRGAEEGHDSVDTWRQERIEAMRADLARLPSRPVTVAYRHVRDRAVAYIKSVRSIDEGREVLRDVAEITSDFLPPALCDRLLELRQQLDNAPRSLRDVPGLLRDRAIQAVRSLRTEPISFADDGPRNACHALLRLPGILELAQPERELLQQAADCPDGAVPPGSLLEELRLLQGMLLDRMQEQRVVAGPPPVLAAVSDLLAEVTAALHERVRTTAAGEESALSEYLHDLEKDAEGVRRAVMQYTAVLASTVQQAVTRRMAALKGLDSGIVFDNVVIEEAARANPLDLFIPMSTARRRIILVGDHRQLPHILEPDVEAKLERSVVQETQEALKRSLFERLFVSLRARQKEDGIQRVITLDRQYRMHPVLGSFVSDTFYKPYNEGFESGVRAEDRLHGIVEYGNAVAVWKDIPKSQGGESGAKSKRRPIEAQWIAEEARRILNEHPQLSVGVISFYAAQVAELLVQMEHLGLAELRPDGERAVAASYRERKDTKGRISERLRVGTVDAFQGKEFDVVFLSMTRSNDVRPDSEQGVRRKWGHLTLENRLCVAMSRQRCLLIVAGDAAMLSAEGAARHIRALVEFHALCGGPYGKRI